MTDLTELRELAGKLRARRESVYDYATQGAEWQADALCLEAADALDRLRASLADAERRGIEQMRTRCTDYVHRFLLQRTGMSPKRIADLRAALDALKVEG